VFAPIVAADCSQGNIRQMLAGQNHAVRPNVVGSILNSRIFRDASGDRSDKVAVGVAAEYLEAS
jgi:hypothetical protein